MGHRVALRAAAPPYSVSPSGVQQQQQWKKQSKSSSSNNYKPGQRLRIHTESFVRLSSNINRHTVEPLLPMHPHHHHPVDSAAINYKSH